MKLGPVTKLDKRNKTVSKHFEDDVTSANYDAIVFPDICPIWSNSEAGFRTHSL